MTAFQAVLFDLDGTLMDTVPDILYAINLLRIQRNMPALLLSAVRPIANLGSKAMIKQLFGLEETSLEFNVLRNQLLAAYEQHLADSTQFFPNMEQVLAHLDSLRIPWGIVTNKLARHTLGLLKAMRIDHRAACIICGDSLPTAKPDPAPIRHACQLLQQDPKHCLYVGDAATDVIASKAAGTAPLVALYGYRQDHEDPYTWQADGYIHKPLDILNWISP